MSLATWYDAHVMPRLIRVACAQPPMMAARAKIVPQAAGDVFELGCGGGLNLGLMDPARITSFAGIDPTPELLDDTRRVAQERGIAADLRAGMGEAIPFADASFDTVVTTFTLCSVQEHAQTLREIRRVLRPGGTALFLEHGAAPDPGVAKWQRRIEPVWKRLAGGCHLTRPITSAYEDAGFAISEGGRRYVPRAPRFAGWVEWGAGRPAG
ncbi:class I SAM-dependent methyltransferase [Novosphingobium tardum]|uniref:Class I SAM-dependent methyltransferase n=1 Tax=Novosphingobium tardum TaxID=1538021 RepID=A0ABV8RPF2_9SPHN